MPTVLAESIALQAVCVQRVQGWIMHSSFREHDVKKAFRRVDIRKAEGPDSIPGWVLRQSANQLAPVSTEIFIFSLAQSVIPMCFKKSTIISVPKKPSPPASMTIAYYSGPHFLLSAVRN